MAGDESAAERQTEPSRPANPDDDDLPTVHRELELLVAAGLTPLEPLAAGTHGSAAAIGIHGAVEVGRAADMLLLEADPTLDIRATRQIRHVITAGSVVR